MKYKVGDILIATQDTYTPNLHGLLCLIAGKEYRIKATHPDKTFTIDTEAYDSQVFTKKQLRKCFINKEDLQEILKYNNIPYISTPIQSTQPTTITTTPGSTTWIDDLINQPKTYRPQQEESTKSTDPDGFVESSGCFELKKPTPLSKSAETNPEPQHTKKLTPLSKFYRYIKQTQQYIPLDVQIEYQRLLEDEEKVIKQALFFGRDQSTLNFIEDEDYYFDFHFEQYHNI